MIYTTQRSPLLQLLVGFIAIFLIATDAHSERDWAGFVDYVVDGDTLHIRPIRGGAELKVRLEAMDAPESCQAWGPQARQALAQRVLHHTVQVQSRARDKYGRLLARVSVNGNDVGAWMVAQGHAWAYGRGKKSASYNEEEATARAQGRGLFASRFAERPSNFRRRHGSCYPGH